jgi:hypothetical protein
MRWTAADPRSMLVVPLPILRPLPRSVLAVGQDLDAAIHLTDLEHSRD